VCICIVRQAANGSRVCRHDGNLRLHAGSPPYIWLSPPFQALFAILVDTAPGAIPENRSELAAIANLQLYAPLNDRYRKGSFRVARAALQAQITAKDLEKASGSHLFLARKQSRLPGVSQFFNAGQEHWPTPGKAWRSTATAEVQHVKPWVGHRIGVLHDGVVLKIDIWAAWFPHSTPQNTFRHQYYI